MITVVADPTNNLTRVFEQSLAVLADSGTTAKKTLTNKPHGSALPIHIDPVNLQKRAIADAAKALSALWKVREPPR